jgi:ATP-dependent Zn protease
VLARLVTPAAKTDDKVRPMSRASRTSHALKLALTFACLIGLAVSFTAAAAAAKAKPAPNTETMQVYEKQLAASEIKAVTFRKKSHALHLTLTNGHHAELLYAPSEEKALRAALKAHGVSVVTKSPGHKTLYIIGGIVIVVVIASIAGALLIVRRRRAAAEGY